MACTMPAPVPPEDGSATRSNTVVACWGRPLLVHRRWRAVDDNRDATGAAWPRPGVGVDCEAEFIGGWGQRQRWDVCARAWLSPLLFSRAPFFPLARTANPPTRPFFFGCCLRGALACVAAVYDLLLPPSTPSPLSWFCFFKQRNLASAPLRRFAFVFEKKKDGCVRLCQKQKRASTTKILKKKKRKGRNSGPAVP